MTSLALHPNTNLKWVFTALLFRSLLFCSGGSCDRQGPTAGGSSMGSPADVVHCLRWGRDRLSEKKWQSKCQFWGWFRVSLVYRCLSTFCMRKRYTARGRKDLGMRALTFERFCKHDSWPIDRWRFWIKRLVLGSPKLEFRPQQRQMEAMEKRVKMQATRCVDCIYSRKPVHGRLRTLQISALVCAISALSFWSSCSLLFQGLSIVDMHRAGRGCYSKNPLSRWRRRHGCF